MTKKIPAKTTIRLLHSVAFMNYQDGVAFNGMVTLNFAQLGLTSERDATRALTKLNEALADKIKQYGERWGYELPHYFLYAHEDVATSHGHHVHQLVVIPRGLGAELKGWLQRWARRNFGDDIHPKAVHYKGEYHRDLDDRAKLQQRLVGYIFKSSEDRCLRGREGEPTTLHTVLEVDKRPRAYCAKVQRVAGCSENIANLAQMKCGFWGALHMEEVMSGGFLKDHQAALNLDELLTMLNKIDV